MTRILLIGMMGAGKSTVGRLLAERLACAYLDSDAQVEAATGQTVAELFETVGERGFREAESAALADALSGQGPVVVSVAGGAVLDPENRTRIREAGTVVWLRADPATLAHRLGEGSGRPLLAGDPAGELARLDRERRPFYAELADVVVDVDGLPPGTVADRVLRGTP